MLLKQSSKCQNKALSTYEKECMAILLAVEKWRSYLLGREFIIKTDHKSLSHLTEHKATTQLQQKAVIKLMDLNFRIQYKKGINNAAADALSRCPNAPSINAISTPAASWLDRLQEGYDDDDETKKLISKLTLGVSTSPGYTLQDGIIKFHGRIWVENNELAQQYILQALHSSGIGGHSGIHATYHRVKSLFAWPKLKQIVVSSIFNLAQCVSKQKVSTSKYLAFWSHYQFHLGLGLLSV